MHDDSPQLHQARGSALDIGEAGHAQSVDPFLIFVFRAEEQRPRCFEFACMNQLKGAGFHLDQFVVGLVGELGGGTLIDLWKNRECFFDGAIELWHERIVSLLPFRLAGAGRHAGRHGQHLIEIENGLFEFDTPQFPLFFVLLAGMVDKHDARHVHGHAEGETG